MSNTDLTSTTTTLTASITASIVSRAPSYVDDHINDFNNPHLVTCESIGAMPNSASVITDPDYTHTDNNFSDDDKSKLDTIYQEFENKTEINNLQSQIDTNTATISDISQQVDLNASEIALLKQNGTGSSSTPSTVANGVVNKNYLYNQEFMVNTRNQSTYDSTTNIQSEHYTVDRWYKTPQSKVMYSVTYGTCKLYNMTTTTMAGVGQYIEKHKELLGKTVTFTLGTGIGEFSTTFDVPADTSTLTANTVLHTETTTFGAIQFEWHTEHFFINILMNPLTDTSDTTYLLLKYAKLELGTVFTGLEDIDKVEETALCAKFYERFIYDSCWLSAICTRTATSTTYEIPMRYTPKRVKPSLKNNTSNRIQVCLTNETPAYVNCSSSGHSSCENNNSMSTVTLSRDEDNSAIMGDKEVISEWCAVKFRSFDFDAEIYK